MNKMLKFHKKKEKTTAQQTACRGPFSGFSVVSLGPSLF